MYSNQFLKYREKIHQLKSLDDFSPICFEINFLGRSKSSELEELSNHAAELVIIDGDTLIIRLCSIDIEDKKVREMLSDKDLSIQLSIADKQGNIYEKIIIDDAVFADIMPISLTYIKNDDYILKFTAK